MKFDKIIILILVCLAIIVLPFVVINSQKSTPSPTPQPPKNTNLTIGTKSLNVTVSDTEETRNKGLGGVRNLTDDEGMLFVFEKQNIQPVFWMKGMEMAIDIIWINDGKVTQMYKAVPPPTPGTSDGELKLYAASEPIDYVLEVASGFADRYKIKVGDLVDLSEITK